MPWVYKRNYTGDIPLVPGAEYDDNRLEDTGLYDISSLNLRVKYSCGLRLNVVYPMKVSILIL